MNLNNQPKNLTCLLLHSVIDTCDFFQELHVNFWDLDNGLIDLDIGFLIKRLSTKRSGYENSLIIHIPGVYDRAKFSDLGGMFSDIDIASSIFNENIEVKQYNGKATLITRIKKNNEKIAVLPLDIHDNNFVDIKADQETSSTKVQINFDKEIAKLIKQDINYNYIYTRFRINNIKKINFIDDFSPYDKNILSSYVRTKIFDFRVNESRWIPQRLQSFNGLDIIYPKVTHCFLTISRQYELGNHSNNFKITRSLIEEPIWQRYLSTGNNSHKKDIDNSLGYHWKASISESGIKFFGRFSKIHSSISRVYIFITIMILIGILSSYLTSVIKEILGLSEISVIIIMILLLFLIIHVRFLLAPLFSIINKLKSIFSQPL